MNPGPQSEPGEVIDSVTSHYSRSNLQVYIGKCMKKNTHTHIQKKKQIIYKKRYTLHQGSKIILVKSNNQIITDKTATEHFENIDSTVIINSTV